MGRASFGGHRGDGAEKPEKRRGSRCPEADARPSEPVVDGGALVPVPLTTSPVPALPTAGGKGSADEPGSACRISPARNRTHATSVTMLDP